MSRYLTIGLLSLCLALAAAAAWWHQLAQSRGIELQAAQAQIQQHQRAAEVHRAHIERLEAENVRWDAVETDLKSLEGRDAPLPDALAAAARRLWP